MITNEKREGRIWLWWGSPLPFERVFGLSHVSLFLSDFTHLIGQLIYRQTLEWEEERKKEKHKPR